MKRKQRAQIVAKRSRAGRASVQQIDPEWDHLEERYSQIGSDMRRLAELLVLR